MSQSKEIYDGFYKLIFKDEKVEVEAERRLKICFECPFKGERLGIPKCNKCGCIIKAKVRSESKCPIGKF
jgi:hypothetical protein